MKNLLTLVMLFIATTATFAGGYRVAIQGQKQIAMGHTGVAIISSAESIFFNPAGMSYLDGKLNVSLGASGIISKTVFGNSTFGTEERTHNPMGTPINLYASYKINDKLAVGIAVYTPYGSTVHWEKGWSGSHLVNDIALKAVFIQPTISYKVSDNFSFGAGFIYAKGSVNFNKSVTRNLTDVDGNRSEVTLNKKGISAMGYSLGVMLKPSEKINIGINYRSKVDMVAEKGEATFENMPSTLGVTNTKFNATLPMPGEITTGIAYKHNDKLTLAFDFNHTFWSSYEALTIKFANNPENPTVNLRNYEDASTYRFGAEYKASQKIVVRGGVYFDESPIQDGYYAPETPRNDSLGLTTGFTFNINEKLSLDASLLYVHFKEIENSYDHYIENGVKTPLKGTYKSNAFAPGFGLSYKL